MSTSTQCLDCKHYTGIATCEAFPDGIPQEIFDGRVIHTEPYPGDGGVTYDPIDIESTPDQFADVVTKLADKGLLKGEKGVKTEWRTVTRGGKTFRQRFRVGQKESEKEPEKSQVADVPDDLPGMTLEDFKRNPIDGFVHDPRLDHDEIIAERRHDKGKSHTALSTQFFKNKPVDKKRLLFHEMGHDLFSGDHNKNFMDLVILREGTRRDIYNIQDYKNWFGLSSRPQEIIADAYSVLRTELWRDWVGGKKVEAGRLLFRVATVAEEMGYPMPKDVHKELTEYFDGNIDISRKDKVKITKGTNPGKIVHLPETIQDEIVTLHRFPYTPEQIVSNLETMLQIDCDDDTDLKDQLISKGVIRSTDGKISLDLTLKEMGDWAQSVLSEEVKKFEIPDEFLEAIDIDPKKMSPDQIKAMFAKLKEKGLLNDKPDDKKSNGGESTDKGSEDAQGSRPGLVKKKVTVRRNGKTSEEYRWVKSGEDEPTEKPKKGDGATGKGDGATGEAAGEVPGKLPEKPKGPAIKGLNKPDGEDDEPEDIKGKEFMDWQSGDEIPGGVKVGSKVDIGKFGVHTVKDITGGVIIGEDDKPYAITSIEEVLTEDDDSKGESKDETVTTDDYTANMKPYMEKLNATSEGKELLKATDDYSSSTYLDINAYLRTGEGFGSTDYEPSKLSDEKKEYLDKEADKITKFLESAPKAKGATVYRGMKWYHDDDTADKKFDEFISNVKVGENIELKTFTSTSTDKETATGFAGKATTQNAPKHSVIMEITSKNGVYMNGASMLPGENEILFDKNSQFMVKDMTTDDNDITHITMEEVDKTTERESKSDDKTTNKIEIDIRKL